MEKDRDKLIAKLIGEPSRAMDIAYCNIIRVNHEAFQEILKLADRNELFQKDKGD